MMLSRYILATMIAVMALTPACSTPDGDDMAGLKLQLLQLQPRTIEQARRATANGNAHRYISDRAGLSDNIMDVMCSDGAAPDDDTATIKRYAVNVWSMLRCLERSEFPTFDECVRHLVNDVRDRYASESGAAQPDCVERLHPQWHSMPANIDPQQVDPDDIAEEMLRSETPPAWMIAAGIVVVGAGGVFILASGWGLVLCPLGLEWGCPGDPFSPGETPAPGGSAGGDR
jgi:hypothetical protein